MEVYIKLYLAARGVNSIFLFCMVGLNQQKKNWNIKHDKEIILYIYFIFIFHFFKKK